MKILKVRKWESEQVRAVAVLAGIFSLSHQPTFPPADAIAGADRVREHLEFSVC